MVKRKSVRKRRGSNVRRRSTKRRISRRKKLNKYINKGGGEKYNPENIRLRDKNTRLTNENKTLNDENKTLNDENKDLLAEINKYQTITGYTKFCTNCGVNMLERNTIS